MKKVIALTLFLLFIVAIFVNGCKKQETKTIDEEAVDIEKDISNVLNETDLGNLTLDLEIEGLINDTELLV